eukprot:5842806-Pyramimonas_sp.AAC.1
MPMTTSPWGCRRHSSCELHSTGPVSARAQRSRMRPEVAAQDHAALQRREFIRRVEELSNTFR